ncbi:Progestin and adipoQ receptor family member 6 [Trichoplax sp. H2]|nr:Progestin and adipoQ receptor family member 6 [Trichoplax sp. H2]|eukprot:RDD41815.1 Progestin and adipoQ receptor family member 6 [Trichoplax sp. H2]
MAAQNQLLDADQIPAIFRDDHIIRGYRKPGLTVIQCIKSMLQMNNETVNFWTHMIPFLYFLIRFYIIDQQYQLVEDPFYWPLLCYIVGSSYPLFSCIAHALNCMSESARHICFFLDYASISLYSFTCAIAYFYYLRPVTFFTMDWYITLSSMMAICCCLTSCISRLYAHTSRPYIYRTLAFALQWVYVNSMLAYRIFSCHHHQCRLTSDYYHTMQFVMAILVAIFMTSKFPECVWPTSFDICGQSHHWFHIFVCVGHRYQLDGILKDIQQRQHVIRLIKPTFSSTLGVLFVVIACNSIIVIYFSYLIIRRSNRAKQVKST